MLYHFDPEDARKYGIDEAILLHNIVGWLRLNRANGRNCYDGRVWTYNTARALVDVMQRIWNEDQVRRLINSLVKQNVLLKGNYNREVGRRADDRTLWLALVDEDRLDMPSGNEPPAKMRQAAHKNQAATQPDSASQASGKNAGRLPKKCGTPPADSPDASGKNAGHIQVQKETTKETAEEKQQQPLLPPHLPFDEVSSQDVAQSTAQDAAAAVSLRCSDEPKKLTEPENLPPLVLSEREAELRLVSRALQDCGVTRCEADLLCANTHGGGFSLDDIRDQIAWLPYRNATNPGYWLPKYIRDGWPKPKGLLEAERQEARQRLKDLEKRALGPSPRQVEEAKQAARETFLAGLSESERETIFEEAHAALSQSTMAREYLLKSGMGREAGGYQALWKPELRRIVDARISAKDTDYDQEESHLRM